MKTLDIHIKPDLAYIPALLGQVEIFLEDNLPEKERFHVLLALEEAVANIIEHGEVRGQIHIHCQYDREKLQLEIEDQGRPFDPSKIAPPDVSSSLEDRKPGGLGIYFIHQYMDQVEYQYQDHKNLLTLVKFLKK